MADEEIKTETVVEAPVEAQPELPLASEATETPSETPVEATTEPEKVEDQPVEAPKTDWKDKELKKKHAQIMEARRQLEAKEKEIENLRALTANGQPVQPIQPVLSPDVQTAARQLVDQEKYIDACNATASVGEGRYKTDWKEAISNLETLGGFDMTTMKGLLATDDPAKVLYEIGKNPDHYHRIMEMAPERRIIEMSKIAMRPEQPKKISEAPAPVNPVGGRAAPAATTLTDNMDDDAWYAARSAQRRAKREAATRR